MEDTFKPADDFIPGLDDCKHEKIDWDNPEDIEIDPDYIRFTLRNL